jgi:hypothetical protein
MYHLPSKATRGTNGPATLDESRAVDNATNNGDVEVPGSILQNFISAESTSDKFSSSSFGQISTKNRT